MILCSTQIVNFVKKATLTSLLVSAGNFLVITPLYPTDKSESQKKGLLGAIAFAGVIAGLKIGYNQYINYSLSCALDRLATNKKLSETIARGFNKDSYILEEEQIIERYAGNEAGYNNLSYLLSSNLGTLAYVDRVTKKDITAWNSYQEAVDFLNNANSLVKDNKDRMEVVNDRLTFIRDRKCLVTLVSLLKKEKKTVFYPIIDGIEKDKEINESLIRSCYGNSLWPLRTAWKDINSRKETYDFNLKEVNFLPQSHYVQKTVAGAQQNTAILENAQRTISSSKNYTDDIRAERSFYEKKEESRQKKQAEDDKIQAKIAEVKAREATNNILKEQEYLRLKIDLQKINLELQNQAISSHQKASLEKQKADIKCRAHMLAIELKKGVIDIIEIAQK